MSNVPTSVGVIMDGNRRFAKENGVPQLEGHRLGLEKVRELADWAQEAGVKEIILYAFSTENWNRSKEEVEYLMNLFEESFDTFAKDLEKKEVKIRFIGQRERLPETLQRKMQEAEEKTKKGTKGIFTVAISYGGRAEIVAATNVLLASGVTSVDEEGFRAAMWTADLAYPDIIIRTGGDQRLSNFLAWQSAYSELFFPKTKWPGFTKEEFDSILADYASRERRLGK
ncbi:MAG: di-trans,poly-cis-decaprenylcistransferase [Candidatus Pacebacteria bacterium]|nr:di-trans,poly-cis-decaprenylcistransferase [Candidatus Paceibacterota bacterium]